MAYHCDTRWRGSRSGLNRPCRDSRWPKAPTASGPSWRQSNVTQKQPSLNHAHTISGKSRPGRPIGGYQGAQPLDWRESTFAKPITRRDQDLESRPLLPRLVREVARVTKCVKPPSELERLWPDGVYDQYFKANYPARETVAVKGLPKNANVEISVIAAG